MKIVINACYGGFGLSDKAIRRYAEIKGLTLYQRKDDRQNWYNPFFTSPDFSEGSWLDAHDIERSDPALVQVVEELGKEASGDCADLMIEDVPAGEKYRIREYDGTERIELASRIAWEVAT